MALNIGGDRPKTFDRKKGKIRQNAGDDAGAPSGYASTLPPDGYTIAPCVIEDVDRGMMALFDSTIGFSVTTKDGQREKVPVIFATGERFAMLNRNKPIRDKQGALILPLISIRRVSIEQASADMSSRGINQHTGDIVIKRRLAPEDRAYQQLINKLGIVQDGSATFGGTRAPVGSYEETGALAGDLDIDDGLLLRPNIIDNVIEVIAIPQPQFYAANYEIVFRTQFTAQMNEMLSSMMSAQLPQGRTFRLDTEKGYWFVVYLDEMKTADDNFTDFTESERIIKYMFSCRVPAYLVAPDSPGSQQSIRRYVSAPRVSFSIDEDPGTIVTNVTDPDARADDPTGQFVLNQDVSRRDQAFVAGEKKSVDTGFRVRSVVRNPFTGENVVSYVRVLGQNKKIGETTYSGVSLKHLTDI